MLIAVSNHSTHFASKLATVSLMAQALNYQLRRHVAPAWGSIPWSAAFYSDPAHVPPGAYPINLFDHSDQAGALGYHDQGPDGKPYGRVFVEEVLGSGGTEYTGDNSVMVTLSHEGIETFGDPQVGSWDQMPDGSLTAHELCDAVEGDSYDIVVGTTRMSVSNFLFPEWFDLAPQGTKFDYMGRLTAPFTMTPGGYLIIMQGGNVSQQFGSAAKPMRASKAHPAARTQRRLLAIAA